MIKIYLTDHAYERFKERSNIKRESAVRMAKKAWMHGIGLDDVSGRLHRYILSKINSPEGARPHVRIYGEIVYIFGKHYDDEDNVILVLITAYPVPKNLRNNAMGQQRRQRGKHNGKIHRRREVEKEDP